MSDKELREMWRELMENLAVGPEFGPKFTFDVMKQVRDQTEQRVRRETLTEVLAGTYAPDGSNLTGESIRTILREELRRATGEIK